MTRPTQARAALYRLYDTSGGLLYVGVTNQPTRRLQEHRAQKSWWGEVAGHAVEWFESEALALRAEIKAITTELPKYNQRSTDAYRAQQSATARAVSAEARRRRGVGVAARAIQVRTLRDLLKRNVPREQAERQAREARQRYREASGLFT